VAERNRNCRPDPVRRLSKPAWKLWRYLSRHPLWSAVLAAAIVTVGGAIIAKGGGSGEAGLPAAGFGPSRPVYWCKRPSSCDGADHVVFNSYANAPNYGDERTFVDAKPASIEMAGGFQDVLEVEPEESVLVRFYVNNAAWGARLGRREGMARGTEARASVPLEPGTHHYIFGFITAQNARPRTVWDGVTLESDEPTILRYEFDSARLWTKHFPAEVSVSDALMEEGTPIGSWALDGRFGNAFVDSGLLTFRVRIEAVESSSN